MRTAVSQLSELLHSASQQFTGSLRRAVTEDFDTDDLTDLLKVAFSVRNQMDAAVSGAVGALDRAARKAPDGELTAGLSSVKYGLTKPHLSARPVPRKRLRELVGSGLPSSPALVGPSAPRRPGQAKGWQHDRPLAWLPE